MSRDRVAQPGILTRAIGWLRHHGNAALDAGLRIVRHPVASLLTVGVIGVALALPSVFLIVSQSLHGLAGSWERGAALSVFMVPEQAAEQVRQRADALAGVEGVASVRLISADEALQEFREQSGLGAALDLLEGNPLPAVAVVQPAPGVDVEAVAARLRQSEGVDTVAVDQAWIKRLRSILALAQRLAWVVGGLLAIAVLLVIANTLRLEVLNRRQEIIVAKLIGATDGFIRRPFLYSGIGFGVFGALLAWLLMAGLLAALGGPVSHLAGLYGAQFSLADLDLNTGLGLLGAGFVLGLLAAWISVGRHIRAIEPR